MFDNSNSSLQTFVIAKRILSAEAGSLLKSSSITASRKCNAMIGYWNLFTSEEWQILNLKCL